MTTTTKTITLEDRITGEIWEQELEFKGDRVGLVYLDFPTDWYNSYREAIKALLECGDILLKKAVK